MATNFPTTLDTLANPTPPTAGQYVWMDGSIRDGTGPGANILVAADDDLTHQAQHENANDAIEALQAKVGVDGSAVTTSHDYKIAQLESTRALKSQTLAIPISYTGVLADGTYTVVLKIPFSGTITEVSSKCSSGTATATVKINSTALGGTANSVSTSRQSQSHSSSNAFSADDDIVITIASASSLTNPVFMIKGTYSLA